MGNNSNIHLDELAFMITRGHRLLIHSKSLPIGDLKAVSRTVSKNCRKVENHHTLVRASPDQEDPLTFRLQI